MRFLMTMNLEFSLRLLTRCYNNNCLYYYLKKIGR